MLLLQQFAIGYFLCQSVEAVLVYDHLSVFDILFLEKQMFLYRAGDCLSIDTEIFSLRCILSLEVTAPDVKPLH